MKKLIVAMACFGVMGACFADDITIRICDSRNRRECTYGTYGATVVKLAEREAIAKNNSMLPTTIDTTEETSDFVIKREIKEEKKSEVERFARGVASGLTFGLSEWGLSLAGKN